MNLETVKRTYLYNLAREATLRDTFAASYREIARAILDEELALKPSHLDPEDWEMLLKIINAQSRLLYFYEVSNVIKTREQPDLFKNLLMLLVAWRDGSKHIYDRYEIQSSEFKEKHSREYLGQGVAFLDSLLGERLSVSLISGRVTIFQEEFESMSETFATVLRAILGNEIFERFRDTVNVSIFHTRCLHDQLSANTPIKH